MSDKTTSKYTRPQRSNAGIVLPEFSLYGVLLGMQEPLAKGTYLRDASPEPVFSAISGLSQEMIEGVYAHLQRTPPRISMGWPQDRTQLPFIAVISEDMEPETETLRHSAGREREDIETVSSEVLTPTGGAVGGETTFLLHHSPVVVRSETLTLTRSSVDTPLSSVYEDYTLTSNGTVTLATALVAGDVLTATYRYRGLPGGAYYATLYEFSHSIIIETTNSFVTSALLGMVWRELVLNQEVFDAAGLEALQFSRRSFSLWEQVQPAIGFRAELVVKGKTQWTAYAQETPIRNVNIEILKTDDGEAIFELVMDIDALSAPDE